MLLTVLVCLAPQSGIWNVDHSNTPAEEAHGTLLPLSCTITNMTLVATPASEAPAVGWGGTQWALPQDSQSSSESLSRTSSALPLVTTRHAMRRMRANQ